MDRIKPDEVPLSVVLDTVLDGIIVIDGEGIICSFNKAATRIFGYSPQETIGHNVKMLMPDPYHSEHDKYIRNYQETGVKKIIGIGRETTGKRKDGTTFPMELGINETRVSGARMFVGTVRDITQRNDLIQQLIESNIALERFAYVASHDLQEPIRMINNFGKILLTEYQSWLDADGKEYLSMVTESGARMRDMVNDLLDYSRLSHEAMKPERFSGDQVLDSALENLKVLIEDTKTEITHDPLPELSGNPVQVMRLLQNLIANAIKYQPPDNTPRIHVGLEDSGKAWLISIQDNGIGIDNRFLKQIFEPFRRLHTWDTIKGSGLGLSICKKLVENNNGSIEVSSTPGKGSRFTITLPKPQIIMEAA